MSSARTLIHASLAALLGLGWAQAQTIYRSTSADGRTTFSDIPTSQASRAEVRPGASPATPDVPALPSALRPVMARFPVTLYATRDCSPCDNARQMLRGRGVPFTEKSIDSTEDIAAFRQLSGANTLPMLSIGSQQFKGYSESSWNQYLSVAGYPETSALPASYRYPLPTPLVSARPAAAPAPVENPAGNGAPMAPQPAGPTPANPAGIAF